jgi:hypothetical protein
MHLVMSILSPYYHVTICGKRFCRNGVKATAISPPCLPRCRGFAQGRQGPPRPPKAAKNCKGLHCVSLIAKYNAMQSLREAGFATGIKVFICRAVFGKQKSLSFASLCDLERALFGEWAVRLHLF